MARWIIFYFILSTGFLFGGAAELWAGSSRISIPQIRYQGGNDSPRPEALRSLLAQAVRRTSIDLSRETPRVKISSPDLYHFPFLYLAGDRKFDPLPEEDIKRLRHYLSYGGFLLIDDNSPQVHSEFDGAVRELIEALFPQAPLQKLSRDHSIYRSFYLINKVAGRVSHNPFLEGISIKGRTVLVYSTNDLGGAWARNKLGDWNYDIIVGGSRQRQLSIRLGINILMYALTLDYKKDMVHLPIILERLRRYHSR